MPARVKRRLRAHLQHFHIVAAVSARFEIMCKWSEDPGEMIRTIPLTTESNQHWRLFDIRRLSHGYSYHIPASKAL